MLDSGELGDPFSYPLEKDIMLWEDLMAEKRIRLKIIRQFEERLWKRIWGYDNYRYWHHHPIENPDTHIACSEPPIEKIVGELQTLLSQIQSWIWLPLFHRGGKKIKKIRLPSVIHHPSAAIFLRPSVFRSVIHHHSEAIFYPPSVFCRRPYNTQLTTHNKPFITNKA